MTIPLSRELRGIFIFICVGVLTFYVLMLSAEETYTLRPSVPPAAGRSRAIGNLNTSNINTSTPM